MRYNAPKFTKITKSEIVVPSWKYDVVPIFFIWSMIL